MDFFDFLEKVIGHVAWPITVLFVIYMFRKQLQNLIGRLKSMAYKDTAIEFNDVQAQIKKQTKKRGNIFDVSEENLTYNNYLDTITLLSNWYANAVLFIPPDKGLDWQRKTAIYTLEKTELKLKEAGREDKTRELIPVLVNALKQGLDHS